MKLTVVIPVYNRIEHIQGLLESILQQEYNSPAELHIYIDYSEKQKEVENKILSIPLPYNMRILITTRSIQYGLKKNIIKSVTETFNESKCTNLILLEDDLYLSPYAFSYAQEMVNLTDFTQNIFGISLYYQHKNEWNSFALNLSNKTKLFKIQLPSSLGSVLHKSQWAAFLDTLDTDLSYTLNIDKNKLPKQVNGWNDSSSWKKELVKHCLQKNLYYVYPKTSYCLHLGENGTHVKGQPNAKRNSNFCNYELNYVLSDISDGEQLDLFFEHLPDHFSSVISPEVAQNVTIDLYGEKDIKTLKKYVLTSKKSKNSILSFGLNMSNLALNIQPWNKGDFFNLCLSKDITSQNTRFKELFEAHYADGNRRNLFFYLIGEFSKKLKRR